MVTCSLALTINQAKCDECLKLEGGECKEPLAAVMRKFFRFFNFSGSLEEDGVGRIGESTHLNGWYHLWMMEPGEFRMVHQI